MLTELEKRVIAAIQGDIAVTPALPADRRQLEYF